MCPSAIGAAAPHGLSPAGRSRMLTRYLVGATSPSRVWPRAVSCSLIRLSPPNAQKARRTTRPCDDMVDCQVQVSEMAGNFCGDELSICIEFRHAGVMIPELQSPQPSRTAYLLKRSPVRLGAWLPKSSDERLRRSFC